MTDAMHCICAAITTCTMLCPHSMCSTWTLWHMAIGHSLILAGTRWCITMFRLLTVSNSSVI